MPGEDFYSWSTTAADNSNADIGINWQEGQARASVNNSARAEMAALAKFRNLISGLVTTAGAANAQTATSGVGYTILPTGLRVMLKIGVANTASATLNMDAIGAVVIKDQFGDDLIGGELVAGMYAEFVYDGTNWILLFRPTTASTPVINTIAQGYANGLGLSYASTTSIAVAPGQAADNTNLALMVLPAAITKTTAAWAVGTGNGGLDTGTIAASTWYHVFLVHRTDMNISDVLFSVSPSAPTTPLNYDQKRRIGSCRTNSSSQFIDFVQDGDYFRWKVNVSDLNLGSWSNTPADTPLTVPTGVNVMAFGVASGFSSLGNAYFALYETAIPDFAAGGANAVGQFVAQVSNITGVGQWLIRTNTSGAIRRVSSDVLGTGSITTFGWIDARGRNI